MSRVVKREAVWQIETQKKSGKRGGGGFDKKTRQEKGNKGVENTLTKAVPA